MRKIIILFFTVFATLYGLAQTTNLVNLAWTSRTGHPVMDYDYMASTKDTAGNVYYIGNTYHLGEQENFLISKYTYLGVLVWQQEFNSLTSARDFGSDIYLKVNAVYVTGTSWDSAGANADFVVLKLNGSTGSVIWGQAYDGDSSGYDIAAVVKADDAGNVFVAGTEQKTASDYKMTIVKYDSTGTRLWTAHYDSSGFYDGAAALLLNPATGNVAVTGFSGTGFGSWDFATVNFNANTGAKGTVTRSSNGNGGMSKPVDMTNDFNGNLYVLGTTALSPTNTDWKILKYDTLLNQVWVKTFGSADSLLDEPTGIAVDYLGQLIIAGYSIKANGGADAAVMRMNLGGSLLWGKTLSADDATKQAKFYDVTVGLDNNVYATGSIYNGADNDYLTASYDINGNPRWQRTYNNADASNEEARNVQVDASSNVYISGVSRTATDTQYVTLLYKQDRAYIPAETDSPSAAYAFYENRGQILVNDSTVADSVFYYTNAGNPQLYVGDKRLSYVLAHADSSGTNDTLYRVDFTIESGSTDPFSREDIYPRNKAKAYLNYYLGNLPAAITRVNGYNSLVQKDVYRGIDWQLSSTTGGLRSYFVVSPHTDPTNIVFKYTGQDSIAINNKRLTIFTALGNIQFDSLVAYEDDGAGHKRWLGINYDLLGPNELGLLMDSFGTGNFLVIYTTDNLNAIPGNIDNLNWSTYLGGGYSNSAHGITRDEAGNIFIAGNSTGGFPTNPGINDTTNTGSNAFVAKFDGNNQLVWSLLYGNGGMSAKDIAYNYDNSIYIVGITPLENLPTYCMTPAISYFQDTLCGRYDGYVAKFNAISGTIEYATYFGGKFDDKFLTIAIDPKSKSAFVGGSTQGWLFPYKAPLSGDFYDTLGKAILVQFDTLNRCIWATGFASENGIGTGFNLEGASINQIVFDNGNNLWIAGVTPFGDNFPTRQATPCSYVQNHMANGPNEFWNGFLAKFSFYVDLGQYNYYLAYASEFGGSYDISLRCLGVDNKNNIYISGSAENSDQFPFFFKSGAYYDTLVGGSTDIFVASFDSMGCPIWSTFYGGTGRENAMALAMDDDGYKYIVGTSVNGNLIFPNYGMYNDSINTNGDAIIVGLDEANNIFWSTNLGGGGYDEISDAIIVNKRLNTVGTSASSQLSINAEDNFPIVGQSIGYIDSSFLPTNVSKATISQFDLNVVYSNIPNDIRKIKAKVYPNPASEFITVVVEQENLPYFIGVYDLYGRILKSFVVNQASYMINVEELSSGSYLLEIDNSYLKNTYKIIKL